MTTFLMDESSITYFCALEYCPEAIPGPPKVEHVLLLFVRYESGVLRIFVHKDWETIIEAKHREYVRALLDDFQLRAKSAPEALLRQVTALAVGPFITHAAGTESDLMTNASLLEACEHFIVLR